MPQLPQFERVIVTRNADIPMAMELISSADVVGTDIETTSLDPHIGRLRLLQVANIDNLKTVVFDFDHLSEIDPICRFLLDPKIVKLFQNAEFDTKYCLKHLTVDGGKVYPESILDLLLGSRLLQKFQERNPDGSMLRHRLEDLALRYVDIRLDKSLGQSDWSGELSSAQIEYACKDVEILFPIAEKISDAIESAGMTDAWRVENRAVLAVAMMSLNGVDIDWDELKSFEKELDDKLWAMEDKIATYLPSPQMGLFNPEPINFKSVPQACAALNAYFTDKIDKLSPKEAKQLGYKFKEKIWLYTLEKDKITGEVKKKQSRASEALKRYRALEPDLVDLLTDYDSVYQAYSTYAVGFNKYRHKITDKIHSNFYQIGSEQHRIKSSKPGLFNIPALSKIGPEVAVKESPRYSERSFRNIFRASGDRKLIICDYDLLQMKIVADHSNDRKLIQAIVDHINKVGIDLHTKTAMLGSGLTLEQVKADKAQRSAGKVLNFTAMFGASAETVQLRLRDDFMVIKPIGDCQKMLDAYFNEYTTVRDYIPWQIRHCNETRKIEVYGGRKVLLKPGDQIYTHALNIPANLTEQSGMKKAMGNMARWLIQNKEDAWIPFYLYDELHINSTESAGERIARQLEKIMIEAMQSYIIHDVPITATANVVDTWASK